MKLRSIVASVEAMGLATYEPMSTIASLEEYFEQREVLDDLNRSITITASLSDAIDELQDVEDTVEVIEEGGQYGDQAVDMHLSAVNRVKELIGDEPMVLPSVESRGDASSMRLVISAESKGVMAKAWEGLVTFLKKVYDAIANAIKSLFGKKAAEQDKAVKKNIADANVAMAACMGSLKEMEVKDKARSDQLDKLIAMAEGCLDTAAKQAKAFGAPDENILKTVEEVDEYFMGAPAVAAEISEIITTANAPDGDKLLEGSAKNVIAGDIRILQESDKRDEALLEKSGKLLKKAIEVAEEGKGGKGAQEAVKLASKVANAAIKTAEQSARQKQNARNGYAKRQRTTKGKK